MNVFFIKKWRHVSEQPFLGIVHCIKARYPKSKVRGSQIHPKINKKTKSESDEDWDCILNRCRTIWAGLWGDKIHKKSTSKSDANLDAEGWSPRPLQRLGPAMEVGGVPLRLDQKYIVAEHRH